MSSSSSSGKGSDDNALREPLILGDKDGDKPESDSARADARLATLIHRWPTLPEAVREAILTLVDFDRKAEGR